MAVDLYEAPGTEISQGDILELLPHISLNKPLLALSKEAETIFRAVAEPHPQFNDKDGQDVIATCKRTKAILISHDCEIDKTHVQNYLVCPVVPSHRLKPTTQDLLKRNRIYAMLYLPKYGDTLGESFVDFNHVTTLNAEFVKNATRILSLSDLGRRALYVQFIRWLSRWELREIACPSCGSIFDPHINQPVRSK